MVGSSRLVCERIYALQVQKYTVLRLPARRTQVHVQHRNSLVAVDGRTKH